MIDQAVINAIYALLRGSGVLDGYGGEATWTLSGMGLRTPRAAAADPQNVWQNLFTIAGGLIAITGLIGVRTVIQAGGASTMQWRHSVGPTVFDAGTAAITGDAVNTIYVLTGDTTDPIQVGAAGAAVMGGKVVATSTTYGAASLFIVGAGTIDVTMTAAAGTGSTRYILLWHPIDAAATVVAA